MTQQYLLVTDNDDVVASETGHPRAFYPSCPKTAGLWIPNANANSNVPLAGMTNELELLRSPSF